MDHEVIWPVTFQDPTGLWTTPSHPQNKHPICTPNEFATANELAFVLYRANLDAQWGGWWTRSWTLTSCWRWFPHHRSSPIQVLRDYCNFRSAGNTNESKSCCIRRSLSPRMGVRNINTVRFQYTVNRYNIFQRVTTDNLMFLVWTSPPLYPSWLVIDVGYAMGAPKWFLFLSNCMALPTSTRSCRVQDTTNRSFVVLRCSLWLSLFAFGPVKWSNWIQLTGQFLILRFRLMCNSFCLWLWLSWPAILSGNLWSSFSPARRSKISNQLRCTTNLTQTVWIKVDFPLLTNLQLWVYWSFVACQIYSKSA